MKKQKNSSRELRRLQDALIVANFVLVLGVYKGNQISDECFGEMIDDIIELILANVEPYYIALYLELRYPDCPTPVYDMAIALAIDKFQTGEVKFCDDSFRENMLSLIVSFGPVKGIATGMLDEFYARRD